MDVRRSTAGRLIRLAHKVYPPRVTVVNRIHCGNAGEAGRLAGLELSRQLTAQAMQRDTQY